MLDASFHFVKIFLHDNWEKTMAVFYFFVCRYYCFFFCTGTHTVSFLSDEEGLRLSGVVVEG